MPGSPKPRFTAVPALRSSAKKLKIVQRTIIAATIGGFLCGPLALLLSLRSNAPLPAPVVLPAWVQIPPRYEAFATQVAEDYLGGFGTKLGVVGGLDATLGRSNSPEALKHDALVLRDVAQTTYNDKKDAHPYGQYSFSFAFRTPVLGQQNGIGGEGQQWDRLIIDVVVRESPTTAAVLAATPTLRADPWSDVTPDDRLPLVLAGTEVPSGVNQQPLIDAISRWGKAYVSNDTTELTQLVNVEGTPGFTYRGLGGFSIADGQQVAVLAMSLAPAAANPAACPANTTKLANGKPLYLARVSIPIVRTGSGYRTSTSFDVLVEGGGVAGVRAWGKAGSGNGLCAYGNALNHFFAPR